MRSRTAHGIVKLKPIETKMKIEAPQEGPISGCITEIDGSVTSSRPKPSAA